MVNSFGDTKRIDRLIVDQKNILVVDYKSSPEAGQQDECQVREYMELVAGIYNGRTVQGYIIYLNDLSLKEVHGTGRHL